MSSETPLSIPMDEQPSLENLLQRLQISTNSTESSTLPPVEAAPASQPVDAGFSSIMSKPSLTVDVSDPPHHAAEPQDKNELSPSSKSTPSLGTTPKGSCATPHLPTNVFVAGIPSLWDDKKLRERFQEYGDIVSVRIVPSRHFGFVMFRKPQAAQAAIKGAHLTRPTPSCTALMHVTISMHDEGLDDVPNERLFIRGLPQWATKEHLRSTFSRFGNIVDCSILMNGAGQCKGAGFVQYSTVEEAKAAIEGGQTARIENWEFELEVKFSETQEVHQQRQERNRERYRFNKVSPGSTPTAMQQAEIMQMQQFKAANAVNSAMAPPPAYHPSSNASTPFGSANVMAFGVPPPPGTLGMPGLFPSPLQSPQPNGQPQAFLPPGSVLVMQAPGGMQQLDRGILPTPQPMFMPPQGMNMTSPGTPQGPPPPMLMMPAGSPVGMMPMHMGGQFHAATPPHQHMHHQFMFPAPQQQQQQQQQQQAQVHMHSPSHNNGMNASSPTAHQMMTQQQQQQVSVPFPTSGDLFFSSPVCNEDVIRSVVLQKLGMMVERIAVIDPGTHGFAVRLSDRNMHMAAAGQLNNLAFSTGHVLSVAIFS